MIKSTISTLVLLGLAGVAHMQESPLRQQQGLLGGLLGGLGGGAASGQQMPGGQLLGGLLGGGRANGQGGPLDSILGGQQGGLLGQNGLLGQGGLLGQQQQQGQGGLSGMLMQLPQRTIAMLSNLLSGVRNIIPGAGNNASNGMGRMGQGMMPRNPLDQLSNLAQQQQGGNPLSGLTNGLSGTLNGLTSNLPAPLNQLGNNLPNLNGLTNGLSGRGGNPLEGAARTVSDLGQGLTSTLSNVMPRGGAAMAGNL